MVRPKQTSLEAKISLNRDEKNHDDGNDSCRAQHRAFTGKVVHRDNHQKLGNCDDSNLWTFSNIDIIPQKKLVHTSGLLEVKKQFLNSDILPSSADKGLGQRKRRRSMERTTTEQDTLRISKAAKQQKTDSGAFIPEYYILQGQALKYAGDKENSSIGLAKKYLEAAICYIVGGKYLSGERHSLFRF